MTQIFLFEDQLVDDMRPVTLTRPAFGVTVAAYNLYDIARMAADKVDYVVRDYMKKVAERAFPCDALSQQEATLFLNAGVAPDAQYIDRIRAAFKEGKPFICTSGQRVAAAMLPAGAAIPDELTTDAVSAWLLGLNLPLRPDELFTTINYPFDIIRLLAKLCPANLALRIKKDGFKEIRDGVFAAADVSIAENAVFHADDGPILLDRGVKILDFTYFYGPLYIGPKTRIIERSSIKEFTSIGHTCKIGGEVEASIIEPYSNKQHYGFLGHAYIGSWVNMGAGTSNSDLKNTYGDIRIEHRGRRLDTKMQFFGCVMGDFAKSAINTSIFTGKIIGVNSMLYGYVGHNVASFCNYAKSFGQITEVTLEQALITQKRMFARRKVEQTDDDIALLTMACELTRDERMISAELPVL